MPEIVSNSCEFGVTAKFLHLGLARRIILFYLKHTDFKSIRREGITDVDLKISDENEEYHFKTPGHRC